MRKSVVIDHHHHDHHDHHAKPRVQATVIAETPFKTPSTQVDPLALIALLSLFGGCPTATPFTGFGTCPFGTNLGLGTGLGLSTLGLGTLAGGVPALCSGTSAASFGTLPGVSPFGASLVF